jgi:hypothetical protein
MTNRPVADLIIVMAMTWPHRGWTRTSTPLVARSNNHAAEGR